MKNATTIMLTIGILNFFLISCGNSSTDKPTEKETTLKEEGVNNETIDSSKGESIMNAKEVFDLKVSAYLVYDDGSLSDFDVLNDKTKALWNTIIGEGDAGKASHKVKVILNGNGENLSVLIKNGKDVAVDKKNVALNGKSEFLIEKTGCDKVTVNVNNATGKFEGTIDFECGE